ncbi:MAG: hypothetical protein HKN22_07495, partial [Bacteroidia bacterium]|nr:hypothetical protein [Bacteroidia bacterium]
MKNFVIVALAIFLPAFLCSNANADQINWLNNSGGNWNDGANWSGAVVPGINDTAVITLAGNYTITVDINPTVDRIILGDGVAEPTLLFSSKTLTLSNGMLIDSLATIDIYFTTITGTGYILN